MPAYPLRLPSGNRRADTPLRALACAALGAMLLLMSGPARLVAQPLSTAAREIIPNASFDQGKTGWLRYFNYRDGGEVKGWNLEFTGGAARITGADRRPGSRVGFRSSAIPLETLAPGAAPAWAYRLEVEWKGRGVLRPAIYALLVDERENLLRQSEFFGPAGDFAQTERFTFLPPESPGPDRSLALMVYVFHDGAGELVVDRVSLTQVKLPPDAAPGAGAPALLVEPFRSPKGRKKLPVGRILVEPAVPAAAAFYDALPSAYSGAAALLGGERRFLAGNAAVLRSGQVSSLGTFRLAERDVARAWDFGVARRVPFWLTPAPDAAPGTTTVVLARGASGGAAGALAPLPADYHLYLYYYGNFRYGGKPADLEHDRAQWRWLRSMGVTGLVVQDNYGLDYGRWKEGKPLDSTFLVEIAGAYKQAGFSSPLVFGLLGGLDKGRVLWSGSEADMDAYLQALAPHIERARVILGEGRLWIAPVDEANDPERRQAAIRLTPLWKKRLAAPLMFTCAWATAQELDAKEKLWVGAGDYPDFAAAAGRGVAGFYTGLSGGEPPLRYRWLAGLHTWAGGFRSQAYWHFCDVRGTAASDLDDAQEDFLCVDPAAADPANPPFTAPFAALLEGVEDLRLLLALETRAARGGRGAGEIRAFLARLRAACPPSDRLPAQWDELKEFQAFRSEAVRYLRGK